MKTKQYRIPSVSGYFSNISTIDKLAVLHDAPIYSDLNDTPRATELQLYFNDLYQVFLHRVSHYALTDSISEKEEDTMTTMFMELIKTKRALRKEK
jgi:hypothetical protein